jgi:hypothetical protein
MLLTSLLTISNEKTSQADTKATVATTSVRPTSSPSSHSQILVSLLPALHPPNTHTQNAPPASDFATIKSTLLPFHQILTTILSTIRTELITRIQTSHPFSTSYPIYTLTPHRPTIYPDGSSALPPDTHSPHPHPRDPKARLLRHRRIHSSPTPYLRSPPPARTSRLARCFRRVQSPIVLR